MCNKTRPGLFRAGKRAVRALFVLWLAVTALIQFAPALAAQYPALDGYRDVVQRYWYAPYVDAVVSNGIMVGVSEDSFGIDDDVTLAQAVTIGARLHRLYYVGRDDIKFGKDVWYSTYSEYAVKNRIISDIYKDYNAPVSKGLFAQILSAAYPDEALGAMNKVEYIPDMAEDSPYYSAVLRLYRAGVCVGNTANDYEPEKKITRVEAAAIIARVLDSSMRQEVTLRLTHDVAFFAETYRVQTGKTVTMFVYSDTGGSDFTFSCDGDEAVITGTTARSVTLRGVQLGTCSVTVTDSRGNSARCRLFVHRRAPEGKPLLDLVTSGAVNVSVNIKSIQQAVLTVHNTSEKKVSFYLPAGSYLSPVLRTNQRMLITTLGAGMLEPGQTVQITVGTACIDFILALPEVTSTYTLRSGLEGTLALLADYFTDNTEPFAVQQAAVWIADGVSFAECGTLVSTVYSPSGQAESTRTITRKDYDRAAGILESLGVN